MAKKTLTGQDFVAVNNIASYCMVTPSTVRRWIRDGKLRAIRLPGGHFRVTVTDLRDFLKSNEIPVSEDLR